jgi:hypothetical protein
MFRYSIPKELTMPDLDRVEGILHPAWRAAYNLIKAWAFENEDRAGFGGPTEVRRRLLDLLKRYSSERDGFPAAPPGWRFGAIDHSMDGRFRDVS